MSRLKLPILLAITESPPVRFWIKKQLQNQFFVIDANTVYKTLETVATSHLDFIILDAALEETDPIELCKKIRAQSPNDHFPILLITGRLKKTYRDKALDAGVTDFLSDQLDPEELDTRIATGKKAAEVREKISLLGSTISTPVATEVPNYFQNRFLLHKQAIEYIDEAKKKKTPIAMLVAQIDGFDQIRLQSRPSTINSMLTQLTDLFMKSIANEDLVTLSSEGQLIGLLSNINEVESKKIAKLIQKKIRENPIQIEERSINLTLSFAISKLVTDEKSFNKTIQTANIALKKPSAKKGNIFSLDHELLG